MADDNNDPPPPAITHVSVKAPAFIDTNPSAYFCIFEAQFMLKNITISSTKFYNVLSALLMKNHHISGRPSIYLNEMLVLADKIQLGDQVIRHQFIQALPSSISPIIASQKDLTLQQLGELADELLPYFNSQTVNAVQPSQQYQKAASADRPSNSNTDQKSEIPIGLRPFNSKQRPVICRAHIYYGENARTCRNWCKYPSKQGCKIQPNSRTSSPVRSNNTLNK